MALKGLPSVSLSLNVPGYPKSNETVKTFFRLCLSDLQFHFRSHRISLLESDAVEQTDEAGDFYISPCSSGSHSISGMKQVCEDFEEKHLLGRFIDVDLTDQAGTPVSSGKAKLCFYCNQRPAQECRRENAHEQEELRTFMFSKMEVFGKQRREQVVCRQLSSLALKSLLYEIALTPKPGLVDRFNQGSHNDMDFRTFLDSSATISGWFADLAKAGFATGPDDLSKALPFIRNIGLQMETAMFSSTCQVNTQKGIIFLMGLSLFACGNLFAGQENFETGRFREKIKCICRGLVDRELENANEPKKTHGEEMYAKYKASGARGEAENGFPIVFDYGLPVLLNFQELNDEAMVRTFLSIAAHNDDTNILFRGGARILQEFKTLSSVALTGFSRDKYEEVIHYCTMKNISPGGSADLLAVTIFIYSVIKLGNGIG
jgi:holo-ACP synthase / triphosphoribosyl-dephospho-CoA synthase